MISNKNIVGIVLLFIFSNKLSAQIGAISILVVPTQSVLQDSLKKEIGKTPIDVKSLKPNVNYYISAKGYENNVIRFSPNKKGIIFPDDLEECYPCLMEFNEPPLSETNNPAGKIKLRKKMPEYKHAIMLALAPAKVEMQPEDIAAIINGKKIKYKNEDIHYTMGYIANLSYPIVKGFERTYIDVFDEDVLKDEKTNLYIPKIIIKPVIEKFEYKLEGKLLRDYTGPAFLKCRWQFYAKGDTVKILGSITTNTSFYRMRNNYDLPLPQLLYEAAQDLAINDTLFAYLESLEKRYLSKTSPAPTLISTPMMPKFATQKEMLKFYRTGVVTVENESGFGSGLIIDPSGIILTNHHVIIDDTVNLKVRILGKDELLTAEVISFNSDYDVALLRLPPGTYSAVSINSKVQIETGDIVYAIGTPLDKSLGQSVTKGIVSGFMEFNGVQFLQTDVSINSGNSGGALITEEGELAGMTTMKAAGKGIEGLAFCIPTETIIKALNIQLK